MFSCLPWPGAWIIIVIHLVSRIIINREGGKLFILIILLALFYYEEVVQQDVARLANYYSHVYC